MRTASTPTGSTRPAAPLAGRFTGGDLSSRPTRALQPARSCGGSRAGRARRARRSSRAAASPTSPSSRRTRRRRDRRLPERPARRARGTDRSDPRSGDRDASRSPSGSSSTRTTAATDSTTGTRRRGRTDRRRRLPRRLARPRVHGRGGDDRRRCRTRCRAFVNGLVGRGCGRLPLGRDLRARARLPAGRRARSRARPRRGSQAATRGTGTSSALPAAGSSRARCSATATRCSTCSSPRGCWADGERRTPARQAVDVSSSLLECRSSRDGPSEQCRARDREILDRQPCRVEERDVLALRRPSAVPDEHLAELRHVVARDEACRDRGGELAAVARLLPVVAEDDAPGDLLRRDLGLSRAVGAHERDVLAGPQRALRVEDLAPGVTVTTTSRASASVALEPATSAPSSSATKPAPCLVDVPDERRPPPCATSMRTVSAVHTAPTTAIDERRRVRACRLRGRRPPRAQRRHRRRRRAPPRAAPSRTCRRGSPARYGREAERRVAGERRYPFQERMPSADGRHRAEVPGRVVRGRTPWVASPTRRVGARRTRCGPPYSVLRRDGVEHGVAREDRDRHRRRLVEALAARVARGRSASYASASNDGSRLRWISPDVGSSARFDERDGSQSCERRNAFEQCVNASSMSTRMPELRHLALDGATARAASLVGTSVARPFTRSVSPTPGTTNSNPTCGLLRMLRSVSARRLPGRSGTSSVRSSRTRTNPGGSPRGLTSHEPSGAAVATRTKGERSTNCRVSPSSRSLTLARTSRLARPAAAELRLVADRAHGCRNVSCQSSRTAVPSERSPERASDAFTAAISLTIDPSRYRTAWSSSASRKSSLSMPAKPGAIDRFMTTARALSTSRIGIP